MNALLVRVDDLEDLQQVIVAGPVDSVLADVLELEHPGGVDDVDAGDVLVDLAAAPLVPEEVELLGEQSSELQMQRVLCDAAVVRNLQGVRIASNILGPGGWNQATGC